MITYGRIIIVTINGHAWRIMATVDGFLYRRIDAYGPPSYSRTMSDVIAFIR